MNYTGIFTYDTSVLLTAPNSLVVAIIVIILSAIFVLAARYFLLVCAGMFLIYQDRKKFANRKKTLSDLVLMKDIQTELEKEIEQATLKAAFQN
ncbi:hypothetical protein HG442_004195 [Candidatus Gracilibacteria bacterium]|nr:hypothetical protein [Candidatus Gracilibacteria bacterium]